MTTAPIMASVPTTPSQRPRTPHPRREKVLIVLDADGWVEVYGGRNIDVKIAHRLKTVGTSPETAKLIDQYLESFLPSYYRNLFVPIHLRAQDQCRMVTPDMEADRLEELYYLRELQALDDEVLIVAGKKANHAE
jgi:hypothetical protein